MLGLSQYNNKCQENKTKTGNPTYTTVQKYGPGTTCKTYVFGVLSSYSYYVFYIGRWAHTLSIDGSVYSNNMPSH